MVNKENIVGLSNQDSIYGLKTDFYDPVIGKEYKVERWNIDV